MMKELLAAAAAKRSHPQLRAASDALRLVDGAGDGCPGVWVESYGGRLLLSTMAGETIPPEMGAWLRGQGQSCYWKRLDRHHNEPPGWLCGEVLSEPFLIREHGLHFEISFQAGYSQGLFLDQRDNRAALRQALRPGLRLLNTFAYTGAFSVAAAMAGAETTTLDLSPPYLDWAKRNFGHNHLDATAHHFCRGDTFHWLRRFARQGRRFDAIVLDAPTFSRDEQGRVFRAEKDFGQLAALAAAVLAPGGWLLCSTNARRLSSAAFARMLMADLPRPMHARHAAMPADFTDEAYLKSVWLT